MGIYTQRVLPRLLDWSLDTPQMEPWRRRCLAGLAGVVVEPGFGSGLNVPFYPPEVKRVLAVDPSSRARELGAERIADSSVKVDHVGLDGQALELDDASCDAALVTFTLCTVADPGLLLQELHRVVRAGGTLHFLEHGRSPDPSVARWQHRLEPLQKRLVDGCHLTRDAEALITEAGFDVLESESDYLNGFKPSSWCTVGRARRLGEGRAGPTAG